MINYRFPLLLIMAITCLAGTTYKTENSIVLAQNQGNWRREMAQKPANEPPKNSSSKSSASDYNRYMQEGYKASQEKNYQKAIEQFKKALEIRPNDIYAQQAIYNTQSYLDRAKSPLNSFTDNGLVVLVGLMMVIGGVSVGVWLFLRRLPSHSGHTSQVELLETEDAFKQEVIDKKENLEPIIIEAENLSKQSSLDIKSERNGSHKIKAKTTNKKELTKKSEAVLPLQTTTRIANLDVIEDLLKDLQEIDPKKRRKAIWELAQKADSRAMKPLVDLMIDTDSQERTLILEALSQISSRTLKPMNQALAISLQDKNPQVRKNAIRDLTRIYDIMSQISQLLAHAIDDPDNDVQETAKWALNQLNLQVPPHLSLLNSESEERVKEKPSYLDSTEL